MTNRERVLQALAEELLTIQKGSVEDAEMLLEDGGGILTEADEQMVRDFLEQLGDGSLQPSREVIFEPSIWEEKRMEKEARNGERSL